MDSTMTGIRPRGQRRRWRRHNGLVVPTAEAVAEALETIPAGLPWAWAALRIFPAVTGHRVQVIDDVELERLGFEPVSSFPTLVMPPGLEVTFAIEVDVVKVTVGQQHLDAWDMAVEDLLTFALANLRRAVGTWQGAVYEDQFEGVSARLLKGWPHWASSLPLLPDELARVFGPEDQLFVAPYACNLISLPIDTDRDVAADLVDVFGLINPRSLLVGVPAVSMRDGVLDVEELPGFPDEPDVWPGDVEDSRI